MYLPPAFRQERADELHAFMRENPLATLVTLGPDGIVANHIPLLVEGDTLVGHVARANPVWRDFSPDVQSLAIFTGPDAYISPNWYASKQEHGRVVPTWNYAAVHVYGHLEIHDDPAWLRSLVTRLTETHEAQFEQPWQVTDAPADYIDGLLKAIVGIEIKIESIQGKWKMGQNRPLADRRTAVAGLMSSTKD